MYSDEAPSNSIAQIQIDFEEINDLVQILGLNDNDEGRALGYIRLATTNGRRYWYASDSYVLGRLEGIAEPNDLDILLPPRLFIGADAIRSMTNEFTLYLCELDSGHRYFILRGDLGEISGPYHFGPYPNVDGIMADADGRPTDFTVEATVLAEAVDSTCYGWNWLPHVDDSGQPLLLFARSYEGIYVSSRWNVGRPTTILLAGEPPHRTIETLVNASKLHDILRRFEGEVRISFGDDPSAPIKFTDGSLTAILMPIRSGIEEFRRHVESMISEVFGPEVLTRDDDGDYQLKPDGVPVWARLGGDDPVMLRVFATVAADIAISPELLKEINELNTNLTFAKVNWERNIVTVSSDLVAETLDAEELYIAFSRVRQIASDMSDVIITMFGGRGVNNDAERWAAYRNTVIVAELYPEARLHLNGPDSIEDWPFVNDVYVITAHNPLGIIRSLEDNRSANMELAMEIARAGGRYCAAIGESRDGDHSEPGFATWNLDFDQVLSLARHFRQEAFFRITSDEFALFDTSDASLADIAPRRV